MRRIIIDVDSDYSIDTIEDHLRNCGISCFGGKEISNNGGTLVSLDDVCKFLDGHLYTGTSTGDYDYGQEYIYSDFDNASDLIFALRKAMEE